jgi:hypothetical protein
MWWIWPEFENDVFVFLACSDFTAFHSRAGHVLVKWLTMMRACEASNVVTLAR